MNTFPAGWRRWVAAALAAIVAVGGFTIAITENGPDRPTGTPKRTIEIRVGAKQVPVVVDADNQVSRAEERHIQRAGPDAGPSTIDLAEVNVPDVHEDMRDETPPGITQAEVNAGREKTEALADSKLTTPQAPAGAQAYSCPDALVRNRSSLNGPRVGTALHFTVSSPGSLDAIRRLFDTPSFGASSNFIIELTGRCRTLVPRTEKAWAQGAGNSAYFSIEIVTNDLSRAQWLAAPIIKRGILAALVRDLNRSIGAPLKLVDPVGCTWTPGVTDHDRLECGNVHWDVGRNFPWDVFMHQVRAGIEQSVTAAERHACTAVHAYRLRRRAGKPKTAPGTATFERRLALVRARGHHCVDGRVTAR